MPAPYGDAFSFLQRSMVRGTPVDRYNRRWRMGPTRSEDDGATGRIGFERTVGATEAWNAQTQDFETRSLLEGQTSRFAISRQQLDGPYVFPMAFQIRGAVIKRQSFVQAFQALLQEGSQVEGWEVRAEAAEETFDEWSETVDRVEQRRSGLNAQTRATASGPV